MYCQHRSLALGAREALLAQHPLLGQASLVTQKKWRKAQKKLANDQREMQREQEREHEESAQHIKQMAALELSARKNRNDELAREYAQERRELEQEHRELVQEHHEDIRELEQERREAKNEWIEERREASLERAEEKREQEQEQREHKRDLRQREQDEKHRIRDKEHRKKDMKRQANYEKMRKKLIPLLISDGFIQSANQKVIIDIEDEDITVNGRQLTRNEHDKYCEIFSSFIKEKGHTKHIKFKPGYMHISAKDQDGHSYSYTHAE